ncbi:MAG: hypothetical protein WCL10_15095 [Novosphingobium sp.]|uniref:hypothetical protein n=1 Tax=Novosphingobium sp. TaxID=1874826 RepID=UPI003016A081
MFFFVVPVALARDAVVPRFALLVASFLAALALPLAARAQTYESTVQPEMLRIPFAPPVGQRLDYEVDITRTGEGKSRTTRLYQALQFERIESGYLLTIATTRMVNENSAIDLSSGAGADRVPVDLRPLTMPVTLEVTVEGAISRVRDWPSLQRSIAGIPAAIAATVAPAKRATAVTLARRVLAPYASMTAEQAPDAVLKGWPSLLGLGGLELISGRPYQSEVASQSPMISVEIPVTQVVTLTVTSEGLFHLVQRSQPDEEKAGLAISQYLDRVGANLNAAQKANLARAGQRFRAMKTRISNDIDLDRQSGIVRRARMERWISLPGMGEGTDVIAVSRIE